MGTCPDAIKRLVGRFTQLSDTIRSPDYDEALIRIDFINKSRIYKPDEMDADHVSTWSKGGDSSAKNCQMLCITHNRAKGNR